MDPPDPPEPEFTGRAAALKRFWAKLTPAEKKKRAQAARDARKTDTAEQRARLVAPARAARERARAARTDEQQRDFDTEWRGRAGKTLSDRLKALPTEKLDARCKPLRDAQAQRAQAAAQAKRVREAAERWCPQRPPTAVKKRLAMSRRTPEQREAARRKSNETKDANRVDPTDEEYTAQCQARSAIMKRAIEEGRVDVEALRTRLDEVRARDAALPEGERRRLADDRAAKRQATLDRKPPLVRAARKARQIARGEDLAEATAAKRTAKRAAKAERIYASATIRSSCEVRPDWAIESSYHAPGWDDLDDP